MRKFGAFIIVLILLASCQNVQRPEKPKDLIPMEKMADILTESYLANAARSANNKFLIKEARMDSLIYKRHGIDSLQFVRSNEYYAGDVNAYISLFEKVEARLDAYLKIHDSIREATLKVTDSVAEKELSRIREERAVKKDTILGN